MQLFSNTVFFAALALLSALAFYPILITNRAFILSVAITYPAGGFAYLVTLRTGGSPIMAAIVGIGIAALLSAVLDWCIVRPFRLAKLPNWKMFIATLGIMVIGQNLFSIFFGDDTTPLRTGTTKAGFDVLGAHISSVQLLTIFAACVVSALLWFILNRTSMGRSIRAIFSDPDLAFALGHNVERIRLYAALIGGAVAGLTGILVGLDTGITPALGFKLLLNGIVVILITGMSGVTPLLVGALVLAFLQNLAAMFLGVAWMESAAYVTLIVFLIWKPHGITGRRFKKVEI